MRVEKYRNIFRPFMLENGTVLKDRVIYSNAQQPATSGAESGPNEAMIDNVAVVARSGAALLNVGHFGPLAGSIVYSSASKNKEEANRRPPIKDDRYSYPYGYGDFPMYDYDDDRNFNLVAQMAQAAHLYNTKILVKLGASFPPGKSLNGCDQPDERLLFPVPEGDNRIRHMMQEPEPGAKVPTLEELKAKIATKEELAEAIEDVVYTCLKYKNAGFDGVSFRGDRWGLNASTNFRDDEYGGEIEGRGRFQYDMYKRIKEVCGPKFLVEVVMPGDAAHGHEGHLPHGYTEDEFVRFMHLVEDYIDIVEIREPTGLYYQALNYVSRPHEHKSPDYAKHLRESGFKKCIAVSGAYSDPEEMEKIISEGTADLIATVRTLLAEPDFMEKLRTQGKEISTPCIRCNKCHSAYYRTPVCSVNPRSGLYHRLPLIVKDPVRSKKVAIIGGGLIGMRTAAFAAERGHQVTIFEKDNKLGGKAAYYAQMYPNQWTMKQYMEWLIDELDRRGVKDIRLNTEPAPEDLLKEGFEAVIACTGSHELRPPIDGADSEGVWLDEDVYFGNVIPGDKVVIVGGGVVASETAMYLAGLGKDVTVLTRQDTLMSGETYPHGPLFGTVVPMKELDYSGEGGVWTDYETLKPVYEVKTKKITPNAVTYEKEGEEITIEADTVIVSGGYEPNTDEAIKYAEAALEFYIAGDAEPGSDNLADGNRGAYSRAILL